MPQLTQKIDVWRMVGVYDQGKTMGPVLKQIPALRIAISRFDTIQRGLSAQMTATRAEFFRPEGSEATDLFLVPTYLTGLLFYDDEIRWGRTVTNQGTVVQHRFTVRGVQEFKEFGYTDSLHLYTKELH